MAEGDHELEHEDLRHFVRLLLVNTWATALGAVAGWIALVVVILAVILN